MAQFQVYRVAGGGLVLDLQTKIPSMLLKVRPIADLSGFDYEIRSALDMVFSGF